MNPSKIAPYGSWKSPITADFIVSHSIGLNSVGVNADNIYWQESRPQEKGRNVLVHQTKEGRIVDITPSPFNVRTRAHEYGGGSFLVTDEGIYFANNADQCLYRQLTGKTPEPLTMQNRCRYADFVEDKSHNRLIAVVEDHDSSDDEPQNYLASIDLITGKISVLVKGDDFYSSPRLSPDGQKIAWISWNHPDMPWDASSLWLAPIKEDGSLGEARCLAGGGDESAGEPRWSPDGQLYFSSDRSGWWNLYRYNHQQQIESLGNWEAEFAYPHWIFGISTYDFASSAEIICTYTQAGRWYLARLDLNDNTLDPFELPYTDISSIKTLGDTVLFIGGTPTESKSIVQFNWKTNEITLLKRSSDLALDPGYVSVPQAIAFPTEDGKEAYAWYYPPQNIDYRAPTEARPPLLVKSHGGPTASASVSLSLRVQYWTSRGFAYVDVNYGGSTGYGREYRQRLEGQWGIVDVQDCINAAKFLVSQGKVDPERLTISGGSAGGFTTLAALTFSDRFKAGASYYGVSDLAALATDTHKFESHYLDRLIGPYPADKVTYRARSPLFHTEQLSCPMIFFQGLQDRVVPPNQAEAMVSALNRKGLPVAYVSFAEEQHGFRQAEAIKQAIEGEFYFYSRIFDFQPADSLPVIPIQNLE